MQVQDTGRGEQVHGQIADGKEPFRMKALLCERLILSHGSVQYVVWIS